MFKFIDLFSGIGGFRLAFEKQGAKCVFSSEIDSKARETYYNNFNEYPKGDITKISSEDIPNHDILCAGFPCQPFSIAGKRLGFEDTRGTLFFEVARILKNKKPKAFLLENVKGIVNHDKGNTIKVIEETLKELEYNCNYKLMNAINYGIPQNRDRWYCIGFRNDLNIEFNNFNIKNDLYFNFPKEKEFQFKLEDIVKKQEISDYEISDKARYNINLHIKKKEFNKKNLIIANDIRPSRCHFKNNGTVPCLTAKMGTGGNNVPVIVNYNRKLTEKECLILMGFPDDFFIEPNSMQSYKQIGNSIVVSIVSDLAKEIIRVLKINNR